MKTREYFEEKLTALREELKQEIYQLTKPLGSGTIFADDDDSDKINFTHNETGLEEEIEIAYIETDEKYVSIFPRNTMYLPIDLLDIMDVHDLMLLHFIVDCTQ